MPLTLATPVVPTTKTIDSVKINSFSVDLDNKEIFVAYSEISEGNIIAEAVITIQEPDFTKTIVDANTAAGVDIYTPLKTSLYNQISLSQPNFAGVVS